MEPPQPATDGSGDRAGTAAPKANPGSSPPRGSPIEAASLPLVPPEFNAPEGDAPVEIDSASDVDTFDTDSALGLDGAGSDTSSLTSSILNYKYENGRTYHAYRDGEYIMPNDEKEQDRLDLVHHVWRLILRGELYRAPIPRNIQSALDVGTGTGIWAMEFADEFPGATIIANDFSPIQPSWVPPNLQFEVSDAEDEWMYNQPFDYIHVRNMGASIANWPKLCAQALHNLTPGGWIEIQEHAIELRSEDGEVPPNITKWMGEMAGAATKFGKEMNVAKEIESFVKGAGFEDVREDKYKIPLGAWAKERRMKELGRYQQVACADSVEPYSLALFTRVLGWEPVALQVFLAAVRAEFMNSKYHLYTHTYIVYGRKPLQSKQH